MSTVKEGLRWLWLGLMGRNSPEEGEPPPLTYKAAFMVGGLAFAVLSYILGSWIYAFELYALGRRDQVGNGLWTMLARIPYEHPFTFFPWVAGTTALAVLLGYLFDRQVKLRATLAALAVTDGLTLVYNHRYFIQQLGLEIRRTQRLWQGFGLLFIDLDNFKQYNDRYRHLAGDDALRLVAQAVRGSVRETDLVARYGGEGFVVLTLGADKEGARMLAERVRRRVALAAPVTVSIGVAVFPTDGESVDALIRAADHAMYAAKGEGKDRVCVA